MTTDNNDSPSSLWKRLFTRINKKFFWIGITSVPLLGGLGYLYLTNISAMLVADAQKHYEAGRYQVAAKKLRGAEKNLRFAHQEMKPKLACQLQVYRGAVLAQQQDSTGATYLLLDEIDNCHDFPEMVAFANETIIQRGTHLLNQAWQAHANQDYTFLLGHAEEVQPYLLHLKTAVQDSECQFHSLKGAAFTHLGQPETAIPIFAEAAQICEPKMVEFAQQSILDRLEALKGYAHDHYNQADYPSVLPHISEAESYFTYLGQPIVAEQYCDLVSLKGATFYRTEDHEQALPVFATAIAECQSFPDSLQRAHIKRSHIYRQQAEKLWSDQSFSQAQDHYRKALKDLDGYRLNGGQFGAYVLMQRSTVKLRLGDLEGSIRDFSTAIAADASILKNLYRSHFDENTALLTKPPDLLALISELKKHKIRLNVAKLPDLKEGAFHYQFSYWSHNYQIINASVGITVDIYKHDDFITFIHTLQHEAIHAAQTCKANNGRPYGFNETEVIHPEYQSPLDDTFLESFIELNYSPEDMPIEREAYKLHNQPNVALDLVKEYCK